jgi:deoxycytidylate deaminase
LNSVTARSELAAAEARCASTGAAIAELRELLATGEPGAASELRKFQKREVREIEARENARAAVRLWTQRDADEQQRNQAEADRIRYELRKIAAEKRAAMLGSLRTWLHGVAEEAASYDAELSRLDTQAGAHSGLVPSTLVCWRQMTADLAAVIRATAPVGNHSD